MLLRIIDRGDDALEIIFQSPLLNKTFPIEFYDSPVYSNFQQSLAWYFKEYPLLLDKAAANDKVAQIVPRMIAFGQSMGDKLSGDDFELVAISEHIAQTGYHQLQVRLESEDIGFFDELWEATVLPEGRSMLSCIAQGFCRSFVDEQLEDLSFNLQVDLPVNDEMAALLPSAGATAGAAAEAASDGGDVKNPLKVIKWVSRGIDDKTAISNSLNASFNAYQQGGLNAFNLINPTDSKALQMALDGHVLHYDGAIVIADNEPFFQLAANKEIDSEPQLISVAQVSQLMLEHKVPCLVLQPSEVLQPSKVSDNQHSPQTAVAMVAKVAQQQGIGNIVGLNQLTPCWVGDLCFEQFYLAVNKGLTVAQAVVEARKALQMNVQIDLVETESRDFHPWSLLNHYGHQKLQYFITDHKVADQATAAQNQFYEKLLGFKTQMLPPLLQSASDGDALSVYHQLERDKKAYVVGERGSGKTQLGHTLALYYAQHAYPQQAVDFCFYFDFASDNYQPSFLQQMIAPVLGLDINNIDKVDELLAQKRCVFVFDNCECMSADVAQFIDQKWQSDNFKMLFIGKPEMTEVLESADNVIQQAKLTLAEQQILIANRLRQLGIKKSPKQAWYDVLAKVDGHPWVIEQLTPLLSENKPETFDKLMAELSGSEDKVSCFYQYQWQKLDSLSKRLLLLCSKEAGLLLEMVMIAFDQKSPQAPSFKIKEQLLSYLGYESKGDADVRFAELIQIWQKAGFVALYPHGRILDSRSAAFLSEQFEQCFADCAQNQDKIDLCFSQLLCQGISMLCGHVLKEPNQNITNNLLLNRRQWVKHFERLWFNQDFQGFMAVKQAFEQLLIQAKLLDDMTEWLGDLLKRTEPVALGQEGDDIVAQLSWLALGANGMSNPNFKDAEHANFITMAERSEAWLKVHSKPIAEQDLPLMQQIVTYLEKYYQRAHQWQACIDVCQLALDIYKQHEAWQRVITVSRTLAQCYQQLGELEKACECEEVIINGVSYEGAPEGFEQQQLMDVLFARLARKDLTAAQTLLDELKQKLDMGPMMGMLEGVQCDIYYQSGDYRAAAPYLCRTWSLSQGDNERLKHVQPRLMELSEKIGEQEFDQIFAENVTEGCIHPSDLKI